MNIEESKENIEITH